MGTCTCVGDASMDDPAAVATVGVASVGHVVGDSTAIWRVIETSMHMW